MKNRIVHNHKGIVCQWYHIITHSIHHLHAPTIRSQYHYNLQPRTWPMMLPSNWVYWTIDWINWHMKRNQDSLVLQTLRLTIWLVEYPVIVTRVSANAVQVSKE